MLKNADVNEGDLWPTQDNLFGSFLPFTTAKIKSHVTNTIQTIQRIKTVVAGKCDITRFILRLFSLVRFRFLYVIIYKRSTVGRYSNQILVLCTNST